jgi:phage-related protein
MSQYFVYDGTSSGDFGIKVKYGGVRNGVSAPTVERMVQIPTRAGAYNYGATLGPRPIELTCHIYSPTDIGATTYDFTPADLMTLCHNIEAWLDPRNGDRALQLPDDGNFYYAHYTGSSDFNWMLNLLEFKLPFVCPDPFPH